MAPATWLEYAAPCPIVVPRAEGCSTWGFASTAAVEPWSSLPGSRSDLTPIRSTVSRSTGCSRGSGYSVDNRRMQMRAVRPFAAIALAAGIVYAATQPSSAAVRPPKLQYEITTLPNGLTLVLSEDHSTPIVHLQL